MAPLSQIYAARAAGASVDDTAPGAQQLNAAMPRNYSPTAFLVAAAGDDATRAVDYVITLAFVNGATYDKAKVLAGNPVP
jgi:hypothetical protein